MKTEFVLRTETDGGTKLLTIYTTFFSKGRDIKKIDVILADFYGDLGMKSLVWFLSDTGFYGSNLYKP